MVASPKNGLFGVQPTLACQVPAGAVAAVGMKAKGLDRIDIKILAALQEDGRMTVQALSELVGLTARPCLERVRRLEKSGLIRRYAALLDLAAFDLVAVIAEIGLEHLHKQAQSKFEKKLAAEPCVV